MMIVSDILVANFIRSIRLTKFPLCERRKRGGGGTVHSFISKYIYLNLLYILYNKVPNSMPGGNYIWGLLLTNLAVPNPHLQGRAGKEEGTRSSHGPQ